MSDRAGLENSDRCLSDNALIFDVYFWITIHLLNDRKRIESELRYRIDDLFREAGLVIAFPQRDVHLDTLHPIRVEITQSQTSATPPEKTPTTTKEEQ